MVAVAVITEDDDDVVDDADVELALDEVLAETILRTSVPEDDDEAPLEVDPYGRRGRGHLAQAG